MSYHIEEHLDETIEKLETVVNIPTHSQKPNVQFRQIIGKGLDGYEAQVDLQTPIEYSFAEMISLICQNHIASYSSKSGINSKKRTILGLEGAPGLGKTHAAYKMGEALGLPVLKITFRSPQEFLGTANNPGDFLRAISYKGAVRNAIVLIDDVDHVLNDGISYKDTGDTSLGKVKSAFKAGTSDWLSMLDPDYKMMYLPYLGTQMDISHYLFVLTSNNEIKNNAIKDRINTITVTGIRAEEKKEIVWDSILPRLLASENPDLNFTVEDLTSDEESIINDVIQRYEKQGFRKVEQALEYFVNQKRSKQEEKLH